MTNYCKSAKNKKKQNAHSFFFFTIPTPKFILCLILFYFSSILLTPTETYDIKSCLAQRDHCCCFRPFNDNLH